MLRSISASNQCLRTGPDHSGRWTVLALALVGFLVAGAIGIGGGTTNALAQTAQRIDPYGNSSSSRVAPSSQQPLAQQKQLQTQQEQTEPAPALKVCGVDTRKHTTCLLAPSEARPTQMTVAMTVVNEVYASQLFSLFNTSWTSSVKEALGNFAGWVFRRGRPQSDVDRFFAQNRPRVVKGPPPVVLTPENRDQRAVAYYLIDHHELVLAARRIGTDRLQTIPVLVIEDMSHLSLNEFWAWMQSKGLVSTIDERGQVQNINRLPVQIMDLRDDPFHSIALLLSEFSNPPNLCFERLNKNPRQIRLWAEYFRMRQYFIHQKFNRQAPIPEPAQMLEPQVRQRWLSEFLTFCQTPGELCGMPGYKNERSCLAPTHPRSRR